MINDTVHAQDITPLLPAERQFAPLNIGDSAPPLRVRGWLKGTAVQQFEKGHVYVVELWATWCAPCKAAMPHLSALANKYKDKVTIIGIDIYEEKTITLQKIKAFVDGMGNRMDYTVAAEDSNFICADWLDSTREREQGIPRSFVVNAEGRLAWIGHPSKLAEVLSRIVNNTWDINEALAKRNFDKHLAALDDSAWWDLRWYMGNLDKPVDFGKPDSALSYIHKMVGDEPKLQYAPWIAFYTFSSLLKTNPHKAYEYGKAVMLNSTYEDPALDAIIDPIKLYSNRLNLPEEIYQLGAEACQVQIDQFPYPELLEIPKLYHNMADWYWRANKKSKAIATEQKAIEALKAEKNFSTAKMAAFELRLQQYRTISQQQRFPLIDKLQ